MAVSPKLITQIPWDATLSHNFEFTYTGNQVYANRLIIKNNITNVTVCDTKTTSFQMYAPIISNLLSNGITYNAQLSVFDINDVESPLSQTIIFQCLSTPIVTFTNLVANQVIRNSYYLFELSYSQTENELLNEYQIILYDSNKVQLATTGVLYNSDTISGSLSGFTDNSLYYVSASYSTVNSIKGITDLIPFSVDYIAPTNWSKLVLENTSDGMIKFSSNVTLITGKANTSSPAYIDGTKIDLTSKNNLLNHTSLTTDKFIDYKNGSEEDSIDDNYATNYISIYPSTTYTISGLTFDSSGVEETGFAWYNVNGDFISGSMLSGSSSNGTYNSPSSAVYIKLTLNSRDLPTAQLMLGSTPNPLLENNYVTFDEGFTISSDFSLEILGQKFTPYSTIAEISNGDDKIELLWMLGKFTVDGNQQAYVVLNAYNSYACSRICSTPMTIPFDTVQVYILLNRVNNLFDLKVTFK